MELSPADAQALEVVRRDLVVVSVFQIAPLSGFPISSRSIMTAAQAFEGGSGRVSVQGVPMVAIVPSDVTNKTRPLEWDWVVVHGITDRFRPNIIDGTVALRRGDRVFIGGYRNHRWPYDPVHQSSREPEIIVGRLVAPEQSGDSVGFVSVQVPVGDYRGFSGGPAAILDEDGQVRVWGVVAR